MKTASPPRKKILKDPFAGVSSDDGECAYHSWKVFRTPVKITSDITGAIVENHKFCASVHYRNVDEKIDEDSTVGVDTFCQIAPAVPIISNGKAPWME